MASEEFGEIRYVLKIQMIGYLFHTRGCAS